MTVGLAVSSIWPHSWPRTESKTHHVRRLARRGLGRPQCRMAVRLTTIKGRQPRCFVRAARAIRRCLLCKSGVWRGGAGVNQGLAALVAVVPIATGVTIFLAAAVGFPSPPLDGFPRFSCALRASWSNGLRTWQVRRGVLYRRACEVLRRQSSVLACFSALILSRAACNNTLAAVRAARACCSAERWASHFAAAAARASASKNIRS